MGKKIITWRDIFNQIKDTTTISKAAILSTPSAATLRLAVLRATSHSVPKLPRSTQITSLLNLGNGSRATGSIFISTLIDRLHRTRNCTVALKCLLIIHHIIKRGPFILQDQLAIFPSTGGYNYLKLSNFHDSASTATWMLSAWVRWYARYVETMLSCSRVLGYFVGSSDEITQDCSISACLNSDLIKDVDSLVGVMVEIFEVPDVIIEDNILVEEIKGLLSNDYLTVVNEISSRVTELKGRLSYLSFGDSVELGCYLRRLMGCKERLLEIFVMNKPSIGVMWDSVAELISRVGVLKVKENEKMLSLMRRDEGFESARFERRVVNSVQFQSSRFDQLNRFYGFRDNDQSGQLDLL